MRADKEHHEGLVQRGLICVKVHFNGRQGQFGTLSEALDLFERTLVIFEQHLLELIKRLDEPTLGLVVRVDGKESRNSLP